MSQENVEIVRAFVDTGNRLGFDGPFENLTSDFEYDLSRAAGPFSGVYTGAQAGHFLAEFAGTWESLQVDPQDFIEAGEHVVTPCTMHMRGRDGIEAQARVVFVWTVRDGSIARVTYYDDAERRQALEAVGLSE